VLEIRDLHVAIADVEILKGITLTIKAGEAHAVMGPNGSGKSTLARTLAGHPECIVTKGEVLYLGKDLFRMPPEERAREGLFLAFQYPLELPGVATTQFLKAAYNALRQHRGLEELDAIEFQQLLKQKLELVDMDPSYLSRSVNENFSGGEKKRNELLQMAVLEPKLAILDEIDSGLDIDALKAVADALNRLQRPDNATLLITHYQRIFRYVRPDAVHVLLDGRIVRSGGPELAEHLEKHGYDWVREQVGASTSNGN
jgi:Fe-S cluster assembly ATP-binding protein